jgi:cell wall-associated NlpC family hydrolase
VPAPQALALTSPTSPLARALTPHSMPPHAMTPHKTKGERAVEAARSKLGHGYSYGSAGPDAFDCSGLVKWSYAQAGVDLPRTSYEQLHSGTPVPLDDLQPGDLVSYNGGSHSAIYAGNGRIIHAATESTGVTTGPLNEMSITGARRF